MFRHLKYYIKINGNIKSSTLLEQTKATSLIKDLLNINPEHNRLHKAQNLTAKQISLSFENKTFVVYTKVTEVLQIKRKNCSLDFNGAYQNGRRQ